MKREKSGRDFRLPAQYNDADWRPIRDLSRIRPGFPVEIIDGNSGVLIGLT